MFNQQIESIIKQAIESAVDNQTLPQAVLDVPVDVRLADANLNCDYATTCMMRMAKLANTNSQNVFATIKHSLDLVEGIEFEFCEPGFLNAVVKPELINQFIDAKPVDQPARKYSIEYVSVNPNGPITVAAARGAAIGDVLSRVLSELGHKVTREYYINDGVNSEQMRLFAESVKYCAMQIIGVAYDMPENGYKGIYVEDIAEKLTQAYTHKHLVESDIAWYQSVTQHMMIESQKSDLAKFGVEFDTWVSEQSLIDAGKVQKTLEHLQTHGQSVVKDGATWLLTKQYGDQDDRVLVRSDGRLTYAASDISYHHDKYERGNDCVIDLFGPDHHGYIPRLKAGVAALGHNPDTLQVLIFQAVRFIKDGQPVLMRKRDGNLYTLIDLVDEIANEMGSDFDTAKDVVRFFYLYVSAGKHMDFNIGLAVKQAHDNPCFYAKYAHARCAAILSKAQTTVASTVAQDLNLYERKLIHKCLSLDYEIQHSARTFNVHNLAHFIVELAKTFHEFYENCRVIHENDLATTQSRLLIVKKTKDTLKRAGDILGLTMPDSM